MRFVRGDVRDHFVLAKIDHGPSQQRYNALQRQGSLEINFREIFGVVRFSTFATLSAKRRHGGAAYLSSSSPGAKLEASQPAEASREASRMLASRRSKSSFGQRRISFRAFEAGLIASDDRDDLQSLPDRNRYDCARQLDQTPS